MDITTLLAGLGLGLLFGYFSVGSTLLTVVALQWLGWSAPVALASSIALNAGLSWVNAMTGLKTGDFPWQNVWLPALTCAVLSFALGWFTHSWWGAYWPSWLIVLLAAEVLLLCVLLLKRSDALATPASAYHLQLQSEQTAPTGVAWGVVPLALLAPLWALAGGTAHTLSLLVLNKLRYPVPVSLGVASMMACAASLGLALGWGASDQQVFDGWQIGQLLLGGIVGMQLLAFGMRSHLRPQAHALLLVLMVGALVYQLL